MPLNPMVREFLFQYLCIVDMVSTVYALDNVNDPADYEAFCLACHDANGAGGNTKPFSDNSATIPISSTAWSAASHNLAVSTFTGSCRDCHDNGHGSNKLTLLAPWNYTNDGNADDPMQQEERFCYTCHNASGPSTKDVMTNYTRPTNWVQQAVGENSLILNDRHDIAKTDQDNPNSGVKIECVSCHNPHTDSPTLKVIADPDPTDGHVPGSIYFTQGTSTTDFWSDWCLDCHDGSYPATIQPPMNALVNIEDSMNFNVHGASSSRGSVDTLRNKTGYATEPLSPTIALLPQAAALTSPVQTGNGCIQLWRATPLSPAAVCTSPQQAAVIPARSL
jgi:hypothetical protein